MERKPGDEGLAGAVLAAVRPARDAGGGKTSPPELPQRLHRALRVARSPFGCAAGATRPGVPPVPPSLAPSPPPVRRGGAEEPPAPAHLPRGAARRPLPLRRGPGVAGHGVRSRAGRRRARRPPRPRRHRLRRGPRRLAPGRSGERGVAAAPRSRGACLGRPLLMLWSPPSAALSPSASALASGLRAGPCAGAEAAPASTSPSPSPCRYGRGAGASR